ncbi:MAG: serine protein kinase, partial [Myxococcota bacterium]|nr:serine protein kinase [Myxococcota bacterium]
MGSLTDKIAKHHDIEEFHELNWTGTFEDYLNIVRDNPRVTRTAWQRLYDMIMSYGSTEYTDSRKKMTSYHFFDDPIGDGADAVFGMDVTVMKLVNTFKSAAHGYGTDKRIILLHGPVGSAKSTVARLLKKGLEAYSRTSEGALYTFDWVMDLEDEGSVYPCALHEDPLHL